MNNFFAFISAYLIGAIPSAYLMGKCLKNIDIRDYGSGNVGATNAFRVLGKVPGSIVLLMDIFKGVLALTVLGDFFDATSPLVHIFLGIAVVSGHNWTIFLKFKGGKGIATSLGVLLGLTIKFSALRPVLIICFLTWLISFIFSGYISLSSIIAASVLPFVMIFTSQSQEMIVLGIIFCFFVILRHRSNITRLRSGTESRVKTPFLKKFSK